METITLQYDGHNISIKKAFELLFTLGVKKLSTADDYPYNRKVVMELQENRVAKGKKIKTADLWK